MFGRKYKRLTAAMLSAAMLFGNAGSVIPGSAVQPETVTVTDMMGREVTINAPVTRVVALQPADCEIIYALGAGDMVVGRGEYCDSPAEVLDVPSVQSGYDTNTEQIIALEPQVLFMSTMAQSEEQIQALEASAASSAQSETAQEAQAPA